MTVKQGREGEVGGWKEGREGKKRLVERRR